MKTYKGWELMKAIADGEIKQGTKFESVKSEYKYIYKKGALWELYNDGDSGFEIGNSVIIANDFKVINDFELLGEQQKIDIQAIEDINIRPYKGFTDICNYIEEKGNEIIKAVKQLDRNIREEE